MANPAVVKVAVKLLKDKRVRNAIITVIGTGIMFLVLLIFFFTQTMQGGSSKLAEQAEAEFQYWENTPIKASGYTCQGEKYCSHFNYPVVDWCCIFIGYCADTVDIELDEIGFSINTGIWKDNLIRNGDYQDPDTYKPVRGDVVLFDYAGRAHHDATGDTQHIGVVVEVSEDSSDVVIIAGNESGSGDFWAGSSQINRYTLSSTDNTIACYGSVGGTKMVFASDLNTLVREVVTRNEVGCLYSELDNEYGTVVQNDNGAISIGVYCWHAGKALDLLQAANQKNATEIRMICLSYGATGKKIYNDIISDASWNSYIPDSYAASCIRTLLLSNSGKEAQDELALEDAQKYIDICTKNGMTDPQAIAYCSDILNQWGDYSFESGGCLNGVTGAVSLEEVYNSRRGWADSQRNYYSRRTWTYGYIKNNPVVQ